MVGTALITGATGFIGKNLIPVLIRFQKIRILVRRTSNIELFKKNSKIEITYGELEKNEGIEQALNGVDTVVHCAARTIGKNFIEYYRTNTTGTANLIKAMNKKKIKKILYLSSHAVCGPGCEKKPVKESDQPNPVSFYGMTKKLAEDIVMNSGINYTILRPVSVYGPYDMEILKYIKLLNRGICPVIGFGEKYINLIFITDLVELIIILIRANKFNNQIYFINDGNCYSYKELLNELTNILGINNLKVYIPETMALFYGLLNDVFLHRQKRLIWRDKVREMARKYWLCSNEKLRGDFNFTPKYMLKQGMKETVDWYRAHGYLK
ncbi:NAD(P)-dependent oxidoreductase [candidate division WOR-3 bacterium]|nr:NAD(P)-dependent oxidoreductase [candidate division WOR-3 bacterium]